MNLWTYGRTTDGACLYYKLPPEPSAQVSKKHKRQKVVNSGKRLCSYIPETRNIVVSEAPGQSCVLKTVNDKQGSLKMVSEFPPAEMIGLGLHVSVSTILLEFVLGDRPDDFVDVLPGLKLKWPQNTQIMGLEFMSLFRRHLGRSSHFEIFSMRLILAC